MEVNNQIITPPTIMPTNLTITPTNLTITPANTTNSTYELSSKSLAKITSLYYSFDGRECLIFRNGTIVIITTSNNTNNNPDCPTIDDICRKYSEINLPHGGHKEYLESIVKILPQYKRLILKCISYLITDIYYVQPTLVHAEYSFIYDKLHPYVLNVLINDVDNVDGVDNVDELTIDIEKKCLENKLNDIIAPEIYAIVSDNLIIID